MTSFLERVGVGIVLPLCLLMSFGCADYSPDIDNIHKRLDAMEDNQIATIESQVVSVNSSISNFEKADADLKEMIANLQKAAGEFEKAISENGESISALKTGLEKAVEDLKNSDRADKEYVLDSLGKAKAMLLALLESEKTELNGKLTSINNTISYLQKKDAELEKKITDLRIYIDKELKETKDWANATFMTLDQYNAIVDQLGGIEGEIAGLKTSMTNLETRLTEKYSKDLKTASDGVKSRLGEEVDGLNDRIDKVVSDITKAYTDAIATFREEMEKWWNESLKKAIDDSEASMKSWVNSTLDGYWTIARTKDSLKALNYDIENQLEAQKKLLNDLISENAGDITALEDRLKKVNDDLKALADRFPVFTSDLNKAKEDLTIAYKKAIEDAITDFKGVFEATIKARVDAAYDSFTKAFSTKEAEMRRVMASINSDLASLDFAGLISSFDSVMQSLAFVPTSDDGSVILSYNVESLEKTIDVSLEIRPERLLSSIGTADVSAYALLTKTRASVGDEVALKVQRITKAKNGVLNVRIEPGALLDDFIAGRVSAGFRVVVRDVSTRFTPLKVAKIRPPLIQYTTASGSMVDISSSLYAKDANNKTLNIVHTKYGEIGFDGDADKVNLNWYKSADLKTIKLLKKAKPDYEIYFRDCNLLEEVDLELLDVSAVTNFQQSFYNCSKLTTKSLKISSWRPQNLDYTNFTFYGCSGLTSLDLSKWKMDKVTSVPGMFNGCSSLETLDLSGWNLDKANWHDVSDNYGKTVRCMFYGCNKLKTIRMVGCSNATMNLVKRDLGVAGINPTIVTR
ncbi:MAG: BspA family leucine-rich repeat surface protein [Bacteroidales bacterium]|nr:BspA family leucine-rich repeat surface protein [Bacteroidales bacterium]